MVKSVKSITRLFLVAFVLGAFSATAFTVTAYAQNVSKQLTSESVIEKIKRRGVVRAGVATFVPWVMRSKEGELIGFEIDVAKKVAADMGVKIEFVPTSFSGIIPALIAGEFDIIMTGIAMNSKRNLTINFSNPYNWGGMAIVASRKLTEGWAPEDFNKSNVVFVNRRGSSDSAETVQKNWPKAKLRQFDDDAQALQDLLNGNAHAFVTAMPKPSNFAVQNPDALWLPMGKQMLLRWPSSFAVRKGDPDILNFLNNWITLNKERGFLEARADFWFRSLEWEALVAK